MPKPSALPEWATAPSDPPNDIVEPSAGKKAEGWKTSERPPAAWWNWWMNLVYRWIQYLEQTTDQLLTDVASLLARFDAQGNVNFGTTKTIMRILSLPSGQPQIAVGGVGPGWEWVFDTNYVWRTRTDRGEIHFPINAHVAAVSLDDTTTYGNPIEIRQIDVYIIPGAPRVGNDNPTVSLISQTISGGVPTTDVHAVAYFPDNTTTPQSVTFSPGIFPAVFPLTMSHLRDYYIAVNGGVDSATNKDKIFRVILRTNHGEIPLG